MESGGGAGKGIAAAVAVVLAVAVLIPLLVVGGGGGGSNCDTDSGSSSFGMGVDGAHGASVAGLGPKQMAIAANGVAVGKQRHEPDSVILAESMAMATESSYRNLANPSAVPGSEKYPHDGEGSDHDSVGPHQIRATMHADGDLSKLMNPLWQINWFYDTADKVAGKNTMDAAALAQAVEVSGPDAYASARSLATKVIAAVSDHLPAVPGGDSTGGGDGGSDSGSCSGAGGDGGPLSGSFAEKIIQAASRWIGTPYAWGGGNKDGPTRGTSDGGGAADANGDSGKVGFDCSGLTLYALAQASGGKILVPHFTGSQQADPHAHEIRWEDKQPGDLIYFGSSAAGSHHVGIYDGKKNGQEMLLNAPESGKTVSIMPLSGWAGEGHFVRRFTP